MSQALVLCLSLLCLVACSKQQEAGGGSEGQSAFVEQTLDGQGRLKLLVKKGPDGIEYGVGMIRGCSSDERTLKPFASPQGTDLRVDFFQQMRRSGKGPWEAFGPVWKVGNFQTARYELDRYNVPVVIGACIAKNWCKDCRG